MMQLSQVARAVNGELFGADVLLQNISINTRDDCRGRLFVALKGENFDAHEFVSQAEQAGATALLVEQAVESDLPTVRVNSTHQALADLASWWRSQFALPVIGITGSVGKTTVKEMLACIFAEFGQGVVTKGNLNNEIGVPLTLMCLKPEDRYAIVEMGMNHAGEIGRLSAMARPTIALVNNAAAAHLENLGTIEAVANAKGEIYQGLSIDGIAIINNDDEYAELWRELAKGYSVMTFGLSVDGNSNADVTASYEEKKHGLVIKVKANKQKLKIKLNSVGEHSVVNALAAVAVALAANISSDSIEAGLANFKPVNGRLNIQSLAGIELIDDTYNANPASMRAAINVLVQSDDNLLVIGDMAELGAAAEVEHKVLGEQAKRRGVKALYVCGEYAELVATSFGAGAIAFTSQAALIERLCGNQKNRDQLSGTILVKGSRSAKMERVVEALHRQLLSKRVDQTSSVSSQGEI
ncbi:MAG: UDP-N-acetylmuramoyl-tripeptide--D-alanyl-D-alanine ligase [Arenicella sp.]|jgi:UDP-N-acetylmuramoyl-tripeptide--D-alanyl-D-alanine ligase